MNLIEQIQNNDEVFIDCINLNEIIENDRVADWLQIPTDFGRCVNIKLNEKNYCMLIIRDVDKNTNINSYLSKKSLAKENKIFR